MAWHCISLHAVVCASQFQKCFCGGLAWPVSWHLLYPAIIDAEPHKQCSIGCRQDLATLAPRVEDLVRSMRFNINDINAMMGDMLKSGDSHLDVALLRQEYRASLVSRPIHRRWHS